MFCLSHAEQSAFGLMIQTYEPTSCRWAQAHFFRCVRAKQITRLLIQKGKPKEDFCVSLRHSLIMADHRRNSTTPEKMSSFFKNRECVVALRNKDNIEQ